MMPGEGGQVTAEMMLVEEGRLPAAMLRATQPPGAVFALGSVMAELFDPRRRVGVTERTPPFNPVIQLPLVADLAADPKLVYLAAKLSELLRCLPALHRPLRLVTAQTNKKRATVAAENLATAEAADGVQPDGVVHAAAAPTPFSETEFLAAVTGLNQAILDEFADDPERTSAYQLGLSLSDLVWVPCIAAQGEEDSPASRPSGLFGLFARSHLAGVQTLLSGAGTQLPSGAATIVSRSLDNWADWIDVNSVRIKSGGADTWSPNADTVLQALRVQGWVWRSVLIADPEVAVQPSMGAWVQAGSSIARAARMVGAVILRRFWPLVVIALATLAGLLYLVISSLSGASQVWASLVTVAAVVGSGTWGLGSGVSQALGGVGYEIWSAAKLDAAAWGVTWLPALTASTVERAKLEVRGVAMPQIRKNLDR
ncbi:MAG TPA: hypothetical protein VHT26_11480 [Trebonia sp.]|nr:hypothetical protein [Trebonia sp.]